MASGKKMSMEEQKKIFDELLKLPDNRNCAECAAKGPRWASTNLGVFMCIRCSGIHRNLGVHISKVKSTTLDQWPVEMVQTMQEIGNARANAYWEARLPNGYHRPSEHSDTYTTEQYIRAKYERKEFVALDDSLNPYIKGEGKKSTKKSDQLAAEAAPKVASKTTTVTPAKKEKAAGKKVEDAPNLLDFGDDNSIPRKASFGAADPFGPSLSMPHHAPQAAQVASSDPFGDIFGGSVAAPPPGVAIQQDFLTSPIQPSAPGQAAPASKESILSLFNSNSSSGVMQPTATTPAAASSMRGPPPLASHQALPIGPNYNIDLRSAIAQSSGKPAPQASGYPNAQAMGSARGFGGPNPGMGSFGGPNPAMGGGFGGPNPGMGGSFGGPNPGMGGFGGPNPAMGGGFGGPNPAMGGGFGGPNPGMGASAGGFGGPNPGMGASAGGNAPGYTPYVNPAFAQQQQQQQQQRFMQQQTGMGFPQQGGFGSFTSQGAGGNAGNSFNLF